MGAPLVNYVQNLLRLIKTAPQILNGESTDPLKNHQMK